MYNAFINGEHFHSNSPDFNQILYGAKEPDAESRANLLFQNQFHATVGKLCFAAMGLRLFMLGDSYKEPVLAGLIEPITNFIACVAEIPQMDEQYKIFSDWIEDNGGCKGCRW